MFFLNSFQRGLWLIPHSNTKHYQPLVSIFVVKGNEIGYFPATRASPGCPEVRNHILALSYIITQPRGLPIILYGKVLEHESWLCGLLLHK